MKEDVDKEDLVIDLMKRKFRLRKNEVFQKLFENQILKDIGEDLLISAFKHNIKEFFIVLTQFILYKPRFSDYFQ